MINSPWDTIIILILILVTKYYICHKLYFSNVQFRSQKPYGRRKAKWQCYQHLDWNLTCEYNTYFSGKPVQYYKSKINSINFKLSEIKFLSVLVIFRLLVLCYFCGFRCSWILRMYQNNISTRMLISIMSRLTYGSCEVSLRLKSVFKHFLLVSLRLKDRSHLVLNSYKNIFKECLWALPVRCY